MSAHIEIWKIFEDDQLATYAFGDMGLFASKAKGKVVILKKTGDIFLVEKTDKTLSTRRFEDAFAPKIRHSLTGFHKQGVFPDRKNLVDSDIRAPLGTGISGAKNLPQWRDVVMTHAIKEKLDKILISFFATSSDGFTKLIGAGFVVVAAGRKALVMTASHNFYLHGLIQSPNNRYPAAALPEFKIHPGALFPVDAEKVKAVYQPGNDAGVCIINGISIIPEIDIALCAIELEKEYTGAMFSHQIGFDSRPPGIGDEVLAIGFSGATTDWPRKKHDKKDQYMKMTRQKALRMGRVTGIPRNGDRHAAGLFFETTIPADAGMLGGPVLPFSPTDLTMNVCAVISKDLSPRSSFKNFSVAGRSIMAMIWPSLLLPFSAEPAAGASAAADNLLELIQKGRVKDAGEADKKILIVKKDLNGWVITRRG